MGLKKFTGTIGKKFQIGILKKAAGVSLYNGEIYTHTFSLPFVPTVLVTNREGKILVDARILGTTSTTGLSIANIIINGKDISILLVNNTGSIMTSAEINTTYYAYE